MNIKKLLISAAVLASCVSLSACGGNSSSEGPAGSSQNGPAAARTIKVAVGKESAEFYKKVLDEYAANTPGFIHKFEVIAADTGTAADGVINDPEAAADIFTVAHDNIGKLIEANCVLPLTNEALVAQVEGNNPQSFLDVIYSKSHSLIRCRSHRPRLSPWMSAVRILRGQMFSCSRPGQGSP